MSPTGIRPPYNREAETACLGSVLLKNSLIDDVFSVVMPQDFYDGRHQIIAEGIFEHRSKKGGEPIDIVTLSSQLKASDQLLEIGGAEYLSSLISLVPTTSNAEYYAQIVSDKSLLRKIIDAGNDIIADALKEDAEVHQTLDSAQQRLFGIIKEKYQDFEDFNTVLKNAFDTIQKHYNDKGSAIGIETGYKKLDDLLAGLHPTNLMVIGGRPSMGKTALALSIIQNISIDRQEKIGVGIFSLEMSKYELCLRLLCAESKIPMEKLRKNVLKDFDWPKLIAGAEKMHKAPIYIDDSPGLTMLELCSKARRMVQLGVKLIVVDYLQLLSGQETQNNISREQFISGVSRGLKMLAKELDIPILALTQLNRSNESRTDKRPLLSDIRESGSIEQDADIVCFVHRQSVYEPEKEELKNEAEIIVGKNRHGKTGMASLYFHGDYPRFENLSEDYSE